MFLNTACVYYSTAINHKLLTHAQEFHSLKWPVSHCSGPACALEPNTSESGKSISGEEEVPSPNDWPAAVFRGFSQPWKRSARSIRDCAETRVEQSTGGAGVQARVRAMERRVAYLSLCFLSTSSRPLINKWSRVKEDYAVCRWWWQMLHGLNGSCWCS